jgi:type VI secretion system Hcp family effector
MKLLFASYMLTAWVAGSLFAQTSGSLPGGTRVPAANPAPPSQAQGYAPPAAFANLDSTRTAVYMTVTGRNVTSKVKIKLLKYEFQLTSPHDVATGLVTGKPSTAAVSITKAWDATSVQLLQAIETNESLSVIFEFMAITAQGKEQTVFTVKLTNALATAIRQSVEAGVPGLSEEVHFTYQKLEFADANKAVSQIDWMAK